MGQLVALKRERGRRRKKEPCKTEIMDFPDMIPNCSDDGMLFETILVVSLRSVERNLHFCKTCNKRSCRYSGGHKGLEKLLNNILDSLPYLGIDYRFPRGNFTEEDAENRERKLRKLKEGKHDKA